MRERDIDPGGQRDDREAAADRQIDAEHPIGADHRQALAEHREPAQPHDGLQPQPAFALPQPLGHRGAADGLTIVEGGHR